MRWGILGPLQVADDAGTEIRLPTGRLRVLLAGLLTQANHAVPVDELVELLWDGAPSARAARTVRVHVVRLRRALGPSAAARIVTQPPGYLCRADEDELDVLRFEKLCRQARSAARERAWPRAAALLTEALGLWRGVPLADVPSDLLRQRELPHLDRLRVQAIEDHVDAEMHLDRHEQLVPQLHDLIARYPLRERPHAQLMRVLARAGRRAEALEVYKDARRVLAGELGIEPGPELRGLQERILAGDAEPAPADATPAHTAATTPVPGQLPTVLDAPAPATPAASEPARAVPRELPMGVRDFTGRSDELRTLTKLLDEFGAGVPGTLLISAIGGTAGVGKTALAVHWAHQVAGRFPDGQLYVNLRGYDPGKPMSAAEALARFLRSLGAPGQEIPADEDERAARYRSILAGRRALVILDNAASVEQVRPLLPGSPSCLVVVTSRDALTGLVAREGATRLDLDLLPLNDAVGLLRALIGGRVDADPDATAQLARQCCRLPLALRVAAELAASRPGAPVAMLVTELEDQQKRLELLDAGGDEHTAVRAVFWWSYRRLDADAARIFRLLGLHPGPDFEPYAIGALSAGTLDQVCHVLDVLARAHLIETTGRDRYALHDLLRAYARDLADAEDTGKERRAALTRLFDYCLAAAAAAMDTLAPAERHRRPLIPPPATPLPPMRTPDAASRWLNDERATLVAVAEHTATRGWPGHTTRLSAVLFRYYRDIGCHYTDALAVHGHALHAAEQSGDRAAQAEALMNRGMVDFRLGRYQQALRQIGQARAIYRDEGDRRGQARAHTNVGVVLWGWDRYQESAEHFQQALSLHRQLGDRLGQALALDNLGTALGRQGHYKQAAECQEQALTLHRELGNRRGEARARANLGGMLSWQGRYQEAVGHLETALGVFREFGDRLGEADVLNDLGVALYGQGLYDKAVGYHEQALAMFRQLGIPSLEAQAFNGLGKAVLAAGLRSALSHYASALRLARETGGKYEQARAYDGLGQAYHAAGDIGDARPQWQQALALYTELGISEAEQVRAQLIAADDDGRCKPPPPG